MADSRTSSIQNSEDIDQNFIAFLLVMHKESKQKFIDIINQIEHTRLKPAGLELLNLFELQITQNSKNHWNQIENLIIEIIDLTLSSKKDTPLSAIKTKYGSLLGVVHYIWAVHHLFQNESFFNNDDEEECVEMHGAEVLISDGLYVCSAKEIKDCLLLIRAYIRLRNNNYLYAKIDFDTISEQWFANDYINNLKQATLEKDHFFSSKRIINPRTNQLIDKWQELLDKKEYKEIATNINLIGDEYSMQDWALLHRLRTIAIVLYHTTSDLSDEDIEEISDAAKSKLMICLNYSYDFTSTLINLFSYIEEKLDDKLKFVAIDFLEDCWLLNNNHPNYVIHYSAVVDRYLKTIRNLKIDYKKLQSQSNYFRKESRKQDKIEKKLAQENQSGGQENNEKNLEHDDADIDIKIDIHSHTHVKGSTTQKNKAKKLRKKNKKQELIDSALAKKQNPVSELKSFQPPIENDSHDIKSDQNVPSVDGSVLSENDQSKKKKKRKKKKKKMQQEQGATQFDKIVNSDSSIVHADLKNDQQEVAGTTTTPTPEPQTTTTTTPTPEPQATTTATPTPEPQATTTATPTPEPQATTTTTTTSQPQLNILPNLFNKSEQVFLSKIYQTYPFVFYGSLVRDWTKKLFNKNHKNRFKDIDIYFQATSGENDPDGERCFANIIELLGKNGFKVSAKMENKKWKNLPYYNLEFVLESGYVLEATVRKVGYVSNIAVPYKSGKAIPIWLNDQMINLNIGQNTPEFIAACRDGVCEVAKPSREYLNYTYMLYYSIYNDQNSNQEEINISNLSQVIKDNGLLENYYVEELDDKDSENTVYWELYDFVRHGVFAHSNAYQFIKPAFCALIRKELKQGNCNLFFSADDIYHIVWQFTKSIQYLYLTDPKSFLLDRQLFKNKIDFLIKNYLNRNPFENTFSHLSQPSQPQPQNYSYLQPQPMVYSQPGHMAHATPTMGLAIFPMPAGYYNEVTPIHSTQQFIPSLPQYTNGPVANFSNNNIPSRSQPDPRLFKRHSMINLKPGNVTILTKGENNQKTPKS